MLRRTLIFTAMVGLASAGCAQAQPAAQTVQLDMTGPRLTAQLLIGDGPPVTAIFDTGAGASVLKLPYAERIGAPNQGQAAAHAPGGTPVQGYRTTIAGQLGDARFERTMAVALDIPLPLEGIDAIISPSVFSGRLVRFDFPNGVAHILPKAAANLPPGPGIRYFDGAGHQLTSIPAVEVTFPGQAPMLAVADSGASRGLLLPLRMAASLPLATPLAPAEPVRMIGVTFQAQTARLNGVVRIGGLEVRDPDITFVDGETPPNVGFSILQRAILVLDPAEHRSWLLPG